MAEGSKVSNSVVPTATYFVCSTPRTGSTLLCSLLESSGVAGKPQSYFRQQDIGKWANRFGLKSHEDRQVEFDLYLQAVLREATTSNGVCAARIMWGSMEEIVAGISENTDFQSTTDAEYLTSAFGDLRFVYIYRRDVIAQAVSWVRAEQSNVWHVKKVETRILPTPQVYSFSAISGFVQTIKADNLAWKKWFQVNGVTPIRVEYEELDANPAGVANATLPKLGIELPNSACMRSPNIRLADDTSLEWGRRYRADLKADQ